MAHTQKPYFVFLRNERVHLNRQGRQFSRLLAAEVCASAVVMLDTHCSELVWRVLATHSIRQFPLHFPSRASPCAITFRLDSTIFEVQTAMVMKIQVLWGKTPYRLANNCRCFGRLSPVFRAYAVRWIAQTLKTEAENQLETLVIIHYFAWHHVPKLHLSGCLQCRNRLAQFHTCM